MKSVLYTLALFFLVLSLNGQTSRLPNTLVVKIVQNSDHKSTPTLPSRVINMLQNNIAEFYPLFPSHQSAKTANSLSGIYLIKLKSEKKYWEQLQQLNNDPSIVYATPYYLPELLGEINDPLVSSQYYLNLIKADTAHYYTQGDTNIVIGITDTGVDLFHDDIKNNIKYNYNDPINGIDDDYDGFIDNFRGWDMGDNDNNPNMVTSIHGTMVAGLAAATCNNNIGIYSIGYKTKILPVKIIDSRGFLSGSYQGIVYAADHGCQIINCSWGSQVPNPLCDDVVNYAINTKNCLVVASAGNASNDQPYYPAACDGVLNVANTNRYDIKVTKSTFGVEVDICAPGDQVLSTTNNNKYQAGWGTSFSSPIVAGCAGLVKAIHPEYTGLQVGEQLRITSDIIDTLPDNMYFYRHMGRGRLNALKAVTIDTLPSVRISDLSVSSSHSTPLPGDTLEVYFTATNYLHQITSTVIQLNSNPEYIKAINNTFSTGFLSTMASVNNSKQALKLKVLDSIPFDTEIELDFKFSGYGYDDYQIFKMLINPSYIDIKQNNIETSFTSNGKIGYANRSKILGKGIMYNNRESMMSEAGIIIGNSRENLVSAFLNEFDFDIVKAIDTITVKNKYLKGTTSFKPGKKYNKLPVKIDMEYKIYLNDELNSVIFYRYKIINESNLAIDNFEFAMFTDWDIDNNYANRILYNEETNLLYTYSTTENNLYGGIAILNENASTPYAFDLVEGGNGGIDITKNFTDDLKWFAMNNTRDADNNTVDTIDVASIFTSLPKTIEANDTLIADFCLIVADTYYELVEKAYSARLLYNQTSIAKNELMPQRIWVYPNPSNGEIIIESRQKDPYTLKLYNYSGNLIWVQDMLNETAKTSTQNLQPGVYILNIESKTGVYTQKIVVTK